MADDAVLVDVRERVATITLNRPDAMNAINADLSAGLMAALRRVREDDEIRVAVLTGAPMRLPRSIPQAFANEMLLLGERIDAETALRFGIVSRVVPAEQLLPTAQEMAAKIAGYAPIAVRGLKEIAAAQADLTLPQAMRLGSALRWIVGQTADAKEGPRAFAEKRAPQFRGE